MSVTRHATLALLALLLTACAALEPETPQPPARQTWAAHSEQLASLKTWTATGKVSLRSPQAAESASLLWQQRGTVTDLQLRGPLGAGATAIYSDGQQLEIRRGDERRVLDISTPSAIRESTGWDLPLQSLVYWLKGLPSPDAAVQQLDLDPATDLLSRLTQNDWQIDYQKYGEFGGITLPKQLAIRRGETEVKLVISHWQAKPG